ncbi:Oxo-4-hydroxy-4-carboxy-5-ureidoimidazoline decarboxylase [Dactylonectria estremocensis]|uniref:Oxo-4-hydroxy-4-carboxy-5-ureidoimidazoline decarboxylase n=1 Tax=Dactylonectria estremocensis TaxID=1079267 RepID=A0A9P9EQ64_9HYPO|nr:Oxo-4-hydroxy-4-carboxy-5-ureidoimidazoline decarboxylase [Dactylonectria estremocensis]
MGLLPIQNLHLAQDVAQAHTLDLLFEPSPAIHDTLIPVIRTAEYASYADLVDACHIRLLSLAAAGAAGAMTHPDADATLLAILASHPRLGAPKVDSAQSAAEQANLQNGGTAEELAALNREYEERFPGLRYVVFVNGRGRPEVMDDMRARIARADYSKEIDAALQAMCDIAKDRAAKLEAQE